MCEMLSIARLTPSAEALASERMLDRIHSQMFQGLAEKMDERIATLICKRLGVGEVNQSNISGRLEMVATRFSAWKTLLLDGRPLARIYPAHITQVGTTLKATQFIEELSGE